ncbi:zinc finger protein ZFP2-like [Syngnathoides biaculeatus]|uniref:zinc finger protein ZFP2-like n=1 Tax=Syngnathoides biaculeatus TaxID=300417 RepID=UPI002ADDD58F|nr:zinc finger protein ZFP2-like [Syngnathoides biaculeatus]XP_061660481.1 zinc finger protein ZFP2-like [Syngnathoides biaculeatus]XP_061660483.1 zinc finger protein ZFP2-like [Syngnathoides biaculeatus]
MNRNRSERASSPLDTEDGRENMCKGGAVAAPPEGGDELHVLVVRWREVGCQWEAPAGATSEVGCQSDVAESRDVAVQADVLTRRLCWRRTGASGASARRPALRAGSEMLRNAAKMEAASPSPPLSVTRPQRVRRPPRWREDLQTTTTASSEPPSGGPEADRQACASTEEEEEEEEEETTTTTTAAAAEGGAAAENLVCDVCGQVMKNKSSLARHSFIHTGQKPFACPLCDLRFNRRDNLSHHVSRLHPGGVARRERRRPAQTWLCDVCGKTFRCRSALKTHEVIHLGVKPHRCDLCPKAYMRTNDLEHHKTTVHGDGDGEDDARRRSGSLLCHFCGKELKFRSQLAAHLQTHTDERPHLCDVCGRKFCRRYQLERHKLLLHADGAPSSAAADGSLSCNVCGKRLKTEALLAAHSRVHSGDKPFRCGLCLRRFVRLACLRQHHARVHLKEGGRAAAAVRAASPRAPKAFPCATCGKVFKFQSLLNNHAAVHSDERPHACDFCPRRFRRLGHLKRHRRVVHRDGARLPQTFVCHICGKDKKCRSQLARHVIIHTGERPFACDLCAARFNRLGNLRQHRKRVHGVDRPPEDGEPPPPPLFQDLDLDVDLAFKREEVVAVPAGDP